MKENFKLEYKIINKVLRLAATKNGKDLYCIDIYTKKFIYLRPLLVDLKSTIEETMLKKIEEDKEWILISTLLEDMNELK